MSKSVKDLVATIMGTREGVLPSIQAFPPVDYDQIARELRLDDRAETAGRVGQPPPQADASDLAELDIIGEIERRARKGNEDYLSQRDLYEGRIRSALIFADQRVKIEAAGQNALADFKATIIDDLNHLHNLRQEVETREEEFRVFQKRNGLTRLPRVTSPTHRVLSLAILCLFVIIESILNGMFFAEGSEAGLIGGVVQAMVLSLLNVGVAALYAWFALPLLFHRSWMVKGLGIVIMFIFIIWLVGLNLSIGHFRDLFILGAGRVQMAPLLNHILNAPLLLDDAKSGLLVLLGIGLGVLTTIDVAAVRDLYPGFAAVGWERQQAIERYAEEKSRCLASVRNLRDRAVDDMNSAIDLIRNAQYEMQLAIDGRGRLHRNYLAFLEHLASVHERLIQRYREANCRARTEPAPAYFRNSVTRPGFLLEGSMLPPTPEIEPNANVAVIARIEHYIKLVNEKFEETVHEYQTIEQLTKHRDLGRATA